MANQHRPSRTTPNMAIPVLGDDDMADYVTGWGTTADYVDTKVPQVIAAAQTSFNTSVSTAQASFNAAITSARNSALPLNLMLMGA